MALGVGSRIGLVGAIPLLGLIGFAGIHMRDVWLGSEGADDYRQAITYAITANGLIHELQRERGAAALFLGSKGTQFTAELREQRQRTDAALASLRTAATEIADDPVLMPVVREAQAAESAVAAAQAQRSDIDALKATGAQTFTALTAPINRLFESIRTIGYVTSDTSLLLPLNSLLDLMQTKEAAGQERATVAAGFAAKTFTAALFERFAGLMRLQDSSLAAFLQEATPEQKALYEKLSAAPAFAEVERFRKMVTSFYDTRSTGDAQAPQWFAASTQRIDLLKQMEDRLSADLKTLSTATAARSRQNLYLAGAITVALVLLVMVLVAVIARGIIQPVNAVTHALQRLAGGDVDAEVAVRARRDQIGAIITAYEAFRSNAKDKIRLEREAAEQRELAERQRAERQAKGDRAVAEIAGLVDQISSGNLDQRINEADKDGDFLRISSQINRMTAMLDKIIGQIARVCGALSEGDLRQSIDGEYHGVFSDLQGSTNGMATRLRDFAGRLGESANAVKLASGEISAASMDLAHRTESQAAAIEETAASMHEVTATVKQNADNAQAANQLATVARDTAGTGGKVVADAVAAVTRIEDSAKKISDIVGLIDEIAFQTNLLALNASVEAARAGEAGKGFAVVAQEVRALAQRSANASKDIKALITESNAQVKTGAGLVNQTGSSLDDIVNAVKKVSDIVAEIAAASREQTTGLEQVNSAVTSMDELTQRNAALVEETSASAQSLATQARELAELVGFFRVA